VRRWHAMNRKLRLNDALPERETEWLIYQALLAIWPPNADAQDPRMLGMLRERFLPWCEKALREAKLRTGWVDPNEPYEAAVLHFAGGLFEPEASAFRAEFSVSIQPFV